MARNEIQLIDFCHQILGNFEKTTNVIYKLSGIFPFTGTEAKTEASVQDNFKPENLTSANLQLKKTGFLVDYFIRPPITLNFHFEHEIWLSHISLETQVGQQKSKGIISTGLKRVFF